MSARASTYRTFRTEEPEPFAAMNITPLIDVMLVILVMMILSVPLMTNEVPLDLPQPGPVRPDLVVPHLIDLDARGGLALDGAPVDMVMLKDRLTALRADPAAEIQIRADGAARYERFDQTLATIKRAGIQRLGFIGNERFQDFSAAK